MRSSAPKVQFDPDETENLRRQILEWNLDSHEARSFAKKFVAGQGYGSRTGAFENIQEQAERSDPTTFRNILEEAALCA